MTRHKQVLGVTTGGRLDKYQPRRPHARFPSPLGEGPEAEELVREIRRRYDSGELMKQVAADLSQRGHVISTVSLCRIGLRHSWSWLPEEDPSHPRIATMVSQHASKPDLGMAGTTRAAETPRAITPQEETARVKNTQSQRRRAEYQRKIAEQEDRWRGETDAVTGARLERASEHGHRWYLTREEDDLWHFIIAATSREARSAAERILYHAGTEQEARRDGGADVAGRPDSQGDGS